MACFRQLAKSFTSLNLDAPVIAPGFALRSGSLGLSGPEDFSITAAAWEAMKARSSSELNSGGSGEEEEEKIDDSEEKWEVGEVANQREDTCSTYASWDQEKWEVGEVANQREDTCSTYVSWDQEKWEVGEVAKQREDTCSTYSSWDLLMDSSSTYGDLLMDFEVVEVANQRGATRLVITPGSWQKGEFLGSGSFGTVYEGISEQGIFFAVKQVSLLDQGIRGTQSVVQVKHEMALLSQFEHENIVRYIGTETDESNLYIFLELATKGSLLSLYRKQKLRDSQVSAYTRQILHGLKYLHDRHIVHRDIKCANILVHANGSVKVADFGLAKAIKLNAVKSCQGTAFWMAPEVVKGKGKGKGYGLPADIWSLGCTVLEMLTGKIPYYPTEWINAMFRIGRGELPPVPDSLSRDARDFIKQCLKVNPDDRPTAAQLLDHKFVQRSLSQSSGSASPHIP